MPWWDFERVVIIAATLILGLSFVAVASRGVSTFERDIGWSADTHLIELNVSQAQIAVFDVLGGDADIDVDARVFSQLDEAIHACQVLAGQDRTGPRQRLADAQERDSASLLCRDLETYRQQTRALLADPATVGTGSVSDGEIDVVFERLVNRTRALSTAVDESIADDAGKLTLLGAGAAALVLLIGGGVFWVVNRHRRRLAAQTRLLAGLATIVRSTGDAISSTSVLGEIRSWNPAAEALYGYTEAEIVGAHGSLLVPERLAAEFVEMWESVSRGEHVATVETIGARKDGTEVPLALTVSPIMDGAEVTGISIVSRDVSQRVAKEAELAAARNEALEASRLKSQFLATMSHEIRTPLNGVIGLNALLLQTPLDQTQRQYAEGVEGAGESLLAVINDILDFSKLEAGKVEFESTTFDPRVLVEEVAALLAVPAHTKGLELLAYCSPEVPLGLVGDPGRIRQVLLNLAGNAVKFTADGEVLIKVEVTNGDAEQPMVRFEVRDTGIGIAAVDQARLFESFSQADASTTRRYGGSGLGLAISQRLVQGMGGEIGVDSELGDGSAFWYTVPLDEAPAAEPGETRRQSPDLLLGLKVLVVDDNATNRLILERQLSAWQLRPDVVDNAEEALVRWRAAAAAGEPYDIAVLDLLMPDMDGLELARLKTADPALDHTRMIMLTSTAHVDVDELAAAGIAQWCTKPVRTSALFDRLMTLMADHRPLPAAPRPGLSSSASGEQSRGRILVVEDNEVNQMVAEGIVTMLGFEVDIVSDGAESLAAIAEHHYDAVLMDCHMPVMDGFEATRAIRRGETTTRIPVIAMTAGALDEDRERCAAAGMDDYVTKPVSIDGLETALQRWTQADPALMDPAKAESAGRGAGALPRPGELPGMR